MKDVYKVSIPSQISTLVGRQNVRKEIEEAVKTLFEEWAHPDLVRKIRVVKPRLEKSVVDN